MNVYVVCLRVYTHTYTHVIIQQFSHHTTQINPLKPGIRPKIIFKISVCTSQETHYVSVTKPNWLVLFRETVAVYCKNHTEHTDILCGQSADFSVVNLVVHIVTTEL
jgi:hypothetical protein